MSDDTVQQIYMKVTQRIQSDQKQLGQIDAQLSGNQREIRLAALTKREVEGLDASVPLYKSMGKMFVQESKADILSDIQQATDEASSMVLALEKKKKFVTRDLEEATGNLKDLVKSSQQQASRS
ncbi:hypothetical protein IWW55_004250 [Coemansia sp. RSA 2706]|nr:hypothetical protein LPJ63_003100 [Coemansia sp. RSA 2711]KAJ2299212.1 hypothetical protein IWW55_004250 [Coemansia sp. RSA 2706]KAJ2305143.1 hypothetical protein IWW54_005171 [Coemansia sp. RSA 2705]KAJ2312249.1 hypothetical protein IWW52_004902 [Coemansia sp. RSA 2704]KAJ2323463.1 hypothetical protein IWW51_003741 [Coemansia sp. RSA 2702]KAJ2362328.1 hypothetical protein H4S01_004834 [Coemansia sp. RSA 2610]KAJ2380876.1 hypothetical protein H4S02_006475 [Coemansia sp. RSA 2611]KAJ271986